MGLQQYGSFDEIFLIYLCQQMKSNNTNIFRALNKHFLWFVLAITMFATNSYIVTTFSDLDSNYIELSENPDKELEEESEESKEETEKREELFSSNLRIIDFYSTASAKNLKIVFTSDTHYLEIPTPPPELS